MEGRPILPGGAMPSHMPAAI